MLRLKLVADLLTFSRAVIALVIVALSLFWPEPPLQAVIWLVWAGWITDALDGPLARRDRQSEETWIGEHDLLVDILLAVSMLAFLMGVGFISPLWTAVYAVVGLLFMLHFRNMGACMCFMFPIDLGFMYVIWQRAPAQTRVILLYLAILAILRWDKLMANIRIFIEDLRQNLRV